jgi:hypothetical protein
MIEWRKPCDVYCLRVFDIEIDVIMIGNNWIS